MWCPGRSVQRRGRSGWPSSPWTAAWCSISAWTSLCPATQPAIELRKVSSAEIQQFSCFLSPSSPAGAARCTSVLCSAGRAGDDCEHGEPGQLRGACLPLAPGGGSHASARPARPANRITATGAAAHCAVLSNCMRCAVWRARASPGCSTSCRSTTSKGISGTAVCHCTHSTTTVFPAVCY